MPAEIVLDAAEPVVVVGPIFFAKEAEGLTCGKKEQRSNNSVGPCFASITGQCNL